MHPGEAVEPVVVLVRNGSRTHSLDTDQRMLRLHARVSVRDNRTLLTAVVPTNSSYAPAGPYLLFVLGRASDPGSSPQRLVPSQGCHVTLAHEQVWPATRVSQVRLTHRNGRRQPGGRRRQRFTRNRAATSDDRSSGTATRAFYCPGTSLS